MRVNLLLNEPPIVGYTNIDAAIPTSTKDKIAGNVFNLDALVDDGECDEIIARNIINLCPVKDVGKVVKNWVNKLQHGGTLTVGTVDLKELSRAVHLGVVDVPTATQVLFGDQENIWRKSVMDIEILEALMERYGLKVINKSFDGIIGLVSGQRP